MGQGMHNGPKNVVLRFLLNRKFIERHHAGVLLQLWIFLRAIDPSFGNLLCHPTFVTYGGAGIWVVSVKLYATHCAVTLPLRSIFPCGLTVVVKRLAIGTVNFVRYSGNLFCSVLFCSVLFCSVMALSLK